MVGDILQPTHLLFILLVALVVLGPKRLPEVGRALGKGLRDFRGAMAGIEEHTNNLLVPDETPQTAGVVNASAVTTAAAPTPVAAAPVAPASQTVSAPAAPAFQTALSPTPVARAIAVEHDPAEYAD